MKTLAAFVRLPAATQRLVLKAVLFMLVARLLADHVPMRWWRHRIHIAASPLPGALRTSPGAATDGSASRIGRIVRKVARRVPFAARCLTQAMAVHWMLRRRGIPSRVVFGVRRSAAPDRALEFHAWARTTKGQIVVGGAEIGTYAQFIAREVTIPDPTDGQRNPYDPTGSR